jgi:hypothetical protein
LIKTDLCTYSYLIKTDCDAIILLLPPSLPPHLHDGSSLINRAIIDDKNFQADTVGQQGREGGRKGGQEKGRREGAMREEAEGIREGITNETERRGQ